MSLLDQTPIVLIHSLPIALFVIILGSNSAGGDMRSITPKEKKSLLVGFEPKPRDPYHIRS